MCPDETSASYVENESANFKDKTSVRCGSFESIRTSLVRLENQFRLDVFTQQRYTWRAIVLFRPPRTSWQKVSRSLRLSRACSEGRTPGETSVSIGRNLKRAEDVVEVVCCANTLEYKRVLEAAVEHGDAVLEVGAQLGDTTSLLRRMVGKAGSVLAVDTPRTMGKRESGYRGEEELEGVTFQEVTSVTDALQLQQLVEELVGEAGATVMALDLTTSTGNDLLLDTMALIAHLAPSQPRLKRVVVKSGAMSCHAGQYHSAGVLLCSPLARSALANQMARQNQVRGALLMKEEGEEAGTGSLKGVEPVVLCGVEVSEYRSCVDLVVREGDTALELGCHLGHTTAILQEAVGPPGITVGLDIGLGNVKLARIKHPSVSRFEVADAWNSAALIRLCPCPDVVFLDVGGISGADGLLEGVALVRQLVALYRPTLRALVVKSTCLQRLARGLVPAPVWLDRDSDYTAK
ncbi:hypothetical protein CYMTET_38111 [Cymbomonas tetramitiformis]|uniref:Uncharacterized protein n=1 Tax=Cymbomonas tetramitiformis TaxID=36881 RepID=A0AAE0CCL7_9CHLO|nr:hypothetical protein CYMTET_38111 [Cymbomonas tetramitiformis]